jgi:hypothetical protein
MWARKWSTTLSRGLHGGFICGRGKEEQHWAEFFTEVLHVGAESKNNIEQSSSRRFYMWARKGRTTLSRVLHGGFICGRGKEAQHWAEVFTEVLFVGGERKHNTEQRSSRRFYLWARKGSTTLSRGLQTLNTFCDLFWIFARPLYLQMQFFFAKIIQNF